MRIGKRLLRPLLALFVCVLSLAAFGIRAEGATERTRIAAMPGGKDLTVMFTFDRENVDIIFISPSGDSIGKEDERLEFASGELWSTYRVADAEAGDWWVEYDRGANDEIGYSLLESSYGLWIQYLRLEGLEDGKLTASFRADREDGDAGYRYELWAVSVKENGTQEMIARGSASANQDNTVTASLNSLNSGSYILKLEVSCSEGDGELFDSVSGEEFAYINPNLPEAIQGARVYLDMGAHTCRVDWQEAENYANRGCQVAVSCDSQEIYHGELEASVRQTTVTYPTEGLSLRISLSYRKGDLWSEPFVWELDLQSGEMLRTRTEEVTGKAQIAVEYAVQGERMLTLSVNDETGQFLLNGSGELGVGLQQGQNQVYGEFESENGVFYVLDELIYYDAVPPEIMLYDDLDGKTFYEDYVDIIGAIAGGESLTVNGEAYALGEQGEFCCRLPLSSGENVAELMALDSNGNASMQVLTLYRGSSLTGGAAGWNPLEYVPLFAALLTSLLVVILAILFLKKKEKPEKTEKKEKKAGKKRTAVKWILAAVILGALEAGCLWGYVRCLLFVRSVKYLETAEHSVARAAEYLQLKRILGIGAIAGGVLLVLFLTTAIVLAKRKKKS